MRYMAVYIVLAVVSNNLFLFALYYLKLSLNICCLSLALYLSHTHIHIHTQTQQYAYAYSPIDKYVKYSAFVSEQNFIYFCQFCLCFNFSNTNYIKCYNSFKSFYNIFNQTILWNNYCHHNCLTLQNNFSGCKKTKTKLD